MPSYRVKNPGFFDGVLYDPKKSHKSIVDTDMPLNPVPSWLELIEDEKPVQRKARKAKTAAKKKANAEKAEEDAKEVDAVTFTESPKSAIVETL
jgi:hypothetical protein